MKFTASDTYNIIAKAAGKDLNVNVYARVVTSLSGSLNDTNWTNVTDYIPNDALTSFKSTLEYEFGQYAMDNASFTGLDINYWNTNFFTDTNIESETTYIELKVTTTLMLGGYSSTENIIPFSGFVDKNTIKYSELDDVVTFDVMTADYISTTMNADSILVTRYLWGNISGSNTKGLELTKIPGLFVTSSNVSSYVLTEGIHELSYKYEYNNNCYSASVKLDDGRWIHFYTSASTVTPDGYLQIGNGKSTSADDSERINLFRFGRMLPTATGSDVTQKIIVMNEGDTYPYTFYRNTSVKKVLRSCFNQIGITSQSYDDLLLDTYDGRKDVSYLDTPPDDYDLIGQPRALEIKNDTTAFIGISSSVYLRNNDTMTYSLITKTTNEVDRLLYDNTNDKLWILDGMDSSTNVKVYDVATATTSSTHNLGHAIHRTSVSLFPQSSSIMYIRFALQDIRQLKYANSAYTASTLFTAAGIPSCSALGQWGYVSESKYLFAGTLPSFAESIYRLKNVGGTWSYDGRFADIAYDAVVQGTMNPATNTIYFKANSNSHIYKVNSGSYSDLGLLTLNANESIMSWFYDASTSKNYFTTKDFSRLNGSLIEVSGSSFQKILPNTIYPQFSYYLFQNAATSTGIYGISADRRLYKYGTELEMYVDELDVEGKDLKSVMNSVCQAFNLIYTVNSNKQAYVYRRSNSVGVPVGTGDTLTITSDEISSVNKEVNKYQKYDLVKIDNESETSNYNGTDFNTKELPRYKILTVKNPYIPSFVLSDLNYYMFNFHNTNRSLYTVELGNIPLFQYEPFDTVTFTTTNGKISNTQLSGLIYGAEYNIIDGTTTFEILI